MAQQPITFEWQVVDDADWDALPPIEQSPDAPPQRAATTGAGAHAGFLAAPFLRSAVLACATLFVAASVALSPDQPNNAQDNAALLATFHLEEQARQNKDEALLNSLIDSKVTPAWQHEWRTPSPNIAKSISAPEPVVLSVETLDSVSDNIAVVQVLVAQATYESWSAFPYREQRFYRRTSDRWLRTTPALTYWGQQLTFETPHLRFEFRERDAAVLMPMMAHIEQLYLALHAFLELETPSVTNKITFAIVPEPVHSRGVFASRHLFTSPRLDKVPADLTDAEYMTYLIIGRLASRAIDTVIGESAGYHTTGYATYGYEWRNIRSATSGWLRNEMLAQRSPWRQQAEVFFGAELEGQLPLQLTRTIARSTGDPFNGPAQMRQYMLAESVVAYIAAAYGPNHLARFVRSLGQYDSWGRLIPAVFDTSHDDFEAGWNYYLRTTYLSASMNRRGVMAP